MGGNARGLRPWSMARKDTVNWTTRRRSWLKKQHTHPPSQTPLLGSIAQLLPKGCLSLARDDTTGLNQHALRIPPSQLNRFPGSVGDDGCSKPWEPAASWSVRSKASTPMTRSRMSKVVYCIRHLPYLRIHAPRLPSAVLFSMEANNNASHTAMQTHAGISMQVSRLQMSSRPMG
jgi:hypothetical protein